MDNGINHSNRIDISPAFRELIDNFMRVIADGKAAEKTLSILVRGILQQGGAKDGVRYGRSDDGLRFEPADVTLTSEQLQSLANSQSMRPLTVEDFQRAIQGQEN